MQWGPVGDGYQLDPGLGIAREGFRWLDEQTSPEIPFGAPRHMRTLPSSSALLESLSTRGRLAYRPELAFFGFSPSPLLLWLSFPYCRRAYQTHLLDTYPFVRQSDE